jgi:hypothetical protein
MEIPLNIANLRSRQEQDDKIFVERELEKRKEFSDREVGISHPDLSSFIRLNDRGDIEIFARPGVGIVISARSKSISFFADSVRFFTKEDGLRWNNYNFNYSASTYSEPTLVKINPKSIHSAQNGISHYLEMISSLEAEESQKPITIDAGYGFQSEQTLPEQKNKSELDLSGLSIEQVGLIQAYSSSYSNQHISLIVKYIQEGLTFDQAHERALREENE